MDKMGSYRKTLDKVAKAESDSKAFEIAMNDFITPVQHQRAAKGLLEKIEKIVANPKPLKIDDIWDDREVFPFKKELQAKVKVNVFLSDVLKSDYPDKNFLKCCLTMLLGAYNDQAVAWLLWAATVRGCGLKDDNIFGILGKYNDEAWLKQLNVEVKSVGVLNNKILANLAELATLGCKGGGVPVDYNADLHYRTSKEVFYKEQATVFSDEELEIAIKAVLSDELGNVKYGSPEEHWSQRWAFTKAGSHARRIEDLKLGGRYTKGSNVTRRNFAESTARNMIAFGAPEIHAGQSTKYENGKNRVIYGCDSISYYTFDYLLKPIEDAWKGQRVLLKPGAGAQTQQYQEWATKLRANMIMIDFDNFNGCHTQRAMALLYKLAFKGAPDYVSKWAVESTYNQFVHTTDGQKKLVGTLLSGHRATSFTNSVLNAAYLRIVLGDDYMRLFALHTGDDVLFSTNEDDLCDSVIRRVMKSQIRANPSKQSCGRGNAEFLRCSFNENGGRGYTARAISSLVSGNWVTENALGSKEYSEALLTNVWAVENRSGSNHMAELLTKTCKRRCPEVTKDVLLGRRSLNFSPIRHGDGKTIDATTAFYKTTRSTMTKDKPSFATQEFLDRHVNHKLLQKVEFAVGSLKTLMLEASYANEAVSEGTLHLLVDYTVTDVKQLNLTKWPRAEVGLLTKYFPLAQIKGQLTERHTSDLLLLLEGRESVDTYREAWGGLPSHLSIHTTMPYGDARMLASTVKQPLHISYKYDLHM